MLQVIRAVKSLTPILTGQSEGLTWIRPEGRGTFLESPAIEKFATSAFEDGQRQFVVDLEACPGMDSTFMGMLAGLGLKFKKARAGELNIVGTSERTRASLLELGLHHLSEIEPEEGPWIGCLEEFRADLTPLGGGGDFDKNAREEHVLKSHENLCETDHENLERFKTVLDMMGSKVREKAPDSSE